MEAYPAANLSMCKSSADNAACASYLFDCLKDTMVMVSFLFAALSRNVLVSVVVSVVLLVVLVQRMNQG